MVPPGDINLYDSRKNQHVVLNNTTPFTPAYVQSSVRSTADPAQIYAERVQGRSIHLENPARVSRTKQKQEKKKALKKTARSHGKWAPDLDRSGVWTVRDYETKYDLFLPLHHLWLGYMSELLGLQKKPRTTELPDSMPNTGVMHAKLVKADFHGSIITVRQSKNPCLVGVCGIVVYESENAFRVITKMDKLKIIPKQNSIFAFAVPLYSTLGLTEAEPEGGNLSTSPLGAAETVLDRARFEFELYGNHFRFRSTDRASRKFKHKETIGL